MNAVGDMDTVQAVPVVDASCAEATAPQNLDWPKKPPADPLKPAAGLVGDLMRYFLESSRYPMHEGACLAAFGLMAGIAGRCFNIDGTGLNLYLLLLAESGRGKEDMDSGIERVLSAVRMQVPAIDECIGPNTFASGQALGRALETNQCFLSIQGEFGLRLRELNDPRAPSSVLVLRRMLLDVYAKSGWGKKLRPTVYSDREKNTKLVHSPCLTILGESTPGHVFDSLSFRDIDDGLLPRCLILHCQSPRPRASRNSGTAPSAELAKRFADFAAICLSMKNSNICHNLSVSDEAVAVFEELQNILDDEFNDSSREAHERTLWNRALLNTKRLAGLIAVGDMSDPSIAPVVRFEHAHWAVVFVEFVVNQLSNKFRDGLVGSGEERQEAEIKRYIYDYLRMSPPRRRSSYKVPKGLSENEGYIGYDYLRRRAKRCAAFTQDRRTFSRALGETLASMCQSGAIYKLQPMDISRRFGTRGEVYAIGDPDVFLG
jgi:Protein of unknown function (DUF3987)